MMTISESFAPWVLWRDTAFQLALRLTMRRLLATLAVVTALLFSAGATHADDTSETNELFVEAVKLVRSASNAEGYEEKAAFLKEALGKLIEIVDDYPTSDLAVKLISGQRIGVISLDGVASEIEEIRIEAENAAAWERGKAKREAKEAREEAERAQAASLREVQQLFGMIRASIEANWSVPVVMRDAGDLVVTIRIRLGRDGAVQSAEILDKDYAQDPNFRAMAESALQAIQRSSPIRQLQRHGHHYNKWREVTMAFYPPL